jgi:DMSO reductase anchor subunit
MCYDRLAVGEAPACVQACPHEAIEIRLVNVSEVRAATAPGTQLLPGTFDSSYTHPTTSYTTTKKMPVDTKSADAEALHLEHPHWPLIVMLVLTQMAVGLTLALAGLSINPEIYSVVGFPLAAGSFTILNVGLIAAIFHLGRPLGAWRFFLGLRTSWMSREILAFCIFAAAAGATILPAFLAHPLAAQVIPASWLSVIQPWIGLTAMGVSSVAALFGLIAVFTSAMIYIDTRRPFWRTSLTLPRFFGATLTLGAGATTVVFASVLPSAVAPAAWVCLAFLVITFAWEMSRHSASLNDSADPTHDSARTLERLLPWWIPIRGCLFIASSAILILTGTSDAPLPFAIAALAFLLIAQVLERFAYFTTVIAPRMPRGN